jgi:hypothetical protein
LELQSAALHFVLSIVRNPLIHPADTMVARTPLQGNPVARFGIVCRPFNRPCGLSIVALISPQAIDELRDAAKKPGGSKKILQLKSRIEELSELPCLVVHYTQIKRHDRDKNVFRE